MITRVLLIIGTKRPIWMGRRGTARKWVEYGRDLILGEIVWAWGLLRSGPWGWTWCQRIGMLLGIEHHLLVRPLCSQLGVGVGGVKVGLWLLLLRIRLLLLWWWLLLVILVKRRIKGRGGDVGSPAALGLLLHRVGIRRMLLQEHLLLLMEELLLLLLVWLIPGVVCRRRTLAAVFHRFHDGGHGQW